MGSRAGSAWDGPDITNKRGTCLPRDARASLLMSTRLTSCRRSVPQRVLHATVARGVVREDVGGQAELQPAGLLQHRVLIGERQDGGDRNGSDRRISALPGTSANTVGA